MRKGYEPARPYSAVRPQGARASAAPACRACSAAARAAIAARGRPFLPGSETRLPHFAGPGRPAAGDARRYHRCARGWTDRRPAAVAGDLPHRRGHTPASRGSIRALSCIPRDAARDAPRRRSRRRQNLLPASVARARRCSLPRNRDSKAAFDAATRRRDGDAAAGTAARGLRCSPSPFPSRSWCCVTQTSVLEAAVSQLPPSVARIVRGAQDYVIVQLGARPRRPALDRRPRSALAAQR